MYSSDWKLGCDFLQQRKCCELEAKWICSDTHRVSCRPCWCCCPLPAGQCSCAVSGCHGDCFQCASSSQDAQSKLGNEDANLWPHLVRHDDFSPSPPAFVHFFSLICPCSLTLNCCFLFSQASYSTVNRDSVSDWESAVGVVKAYQLNTWSQHNCVSVCV